MSHTARFRLSWAAAALLLGGAGLYLLSLAVPSALRLRTQLETWPHAIAHVDSADVVSATQPRAALYSARLWITYHAAGATHSTPVAETKPFNWYGSARKAAAAAARAGHTEVLVDPGNLRSVTLHPAYSWRFFAEPVVYACVGLCLVAFGLVCLWLGLRQGLDRAAVATFAPMSPTGAVVFASIMGALFVIGALVSGYFGRVQSGTWSRVDATVDSADAVRAALNAYSVRRWVTYALGGRTYHAPVSTTSASSDYTAVARAAADARGEKTPVLADPADPYDLLSPSESTGSAIWLPLIMLAFALLCFAFAAILWRRRGSRRKSRTARRLLISG